LVAALVVVAGMVAALSPQGRRALAPASCRSHAVARSLAQVVADAAARLGCCPVLASSRAACVTLRRDAARLPEHG
jgi:hypothetical protein